jgi:hypothetical protein
LASAANNLFALDLETLIDLFIKAFSRLGKFILLPPELVGFPGKLFFPRSQLLLKSASLSLEEGGRNRLRQRNLMATLGANDLRLMDVSVHA